MIRRWSRLNNFILNPLSPFFLRFNGCKLLKSANYRRFSLGLTKFKRTKLARWKRNSSWLPNVSVFKFWIKDYNFFKKITKSQFMNSILENPILIHNNDYIKKKNILDDRYNSIFLSYSIPKFFFNYYYKKFNTFTNLLSLSAFNNSNYVLALFLEKPRQLETKQNLLVYKNENHHYGLDFIVKTKNLNDVFFKIIFFKIISIYKIFSLLFYVKLFCPLKCLN